MKAIVALLVSKKKGLNDWDWEREPETGNAWFWQDVVGVSHLIGLILQVLVAVNHVKTQSTLVYFIFLQLSSGVYQPPHAVLLAQKHNPQVFHILDTGTRWGFLPFVVFWWTLVFCCGSLVLGPSQKSGQFFGSHAPNKTHKFIDSQS